VNTIKLGEDILFIDGGLSTELEILGEDLNNELWSASELPDNPAAIYQAHRNYFDAGANIAITSTYQASLEGFQRRGLGLDQSKQMIRLAIELADRARLDYLLENPHGKAYVAASIGPYGASLADGSEYRGDYLVSAEEIRDFHSSRIELIRGVVDKFDFWAVETLPSLDEALIVADILGKTTRPAWFSFTLRDQQHVAEGIALSEVVKVLDKNIAVSAMGVNCCHPAWVEPALKIMSEYTSKPLLAYPNGGGVYNATTKQWITPKKMELDGAAWIAAGARLIGGCCQTSAKSLKPLYSDWARQTANQ
jgi:homocysteine S-methyltransferase